MVCLRRGDFGKADELFGRQEEYSRRIGAMDSLANALGNLIELLIKEEGSIEKALELAKQRVNARTDTPDGFYGGDAYEFDLKTTPLSRTFFVLRNFKR